MSNRVKLDTPEAFVQAVERKESDTHYTRCPKCGGMLVHSMDGTKCNKCGWTPRTLKMTWKHWT